jgi:hypothetical protein
MPAVDTVLLPLCVGLTLLGIIATGIAWRRGNKGRVVQGVAVALAPVALYFSGLLRLIWNGVVAVGSWASGVIFTPSIWFGLSLLGLCIVLWVVGAMVARRFPGKGKQKKGAKTGRAAAAVPTAAGAGGGRPTSGRPVTSGKTATKPPVDDDMAEIEALLKSRGID